MDIWAACRDAAVPKALEGELIRIVESQEQIATNALVDSLDEQALLEEMLDANKPPAPPGTAHLHYLLAAPFRYPPLKYGSRFGVRQEPSLFYGSKDLSAALAETAYYRFLFWSGMEQPPPGGGLTTELTVFGAGYRFKRGLCLHEEPFVRFEKQLVDPRRYTDTQELGANMRAAEIEGFEYLSARDPDGGINIALFTASAFSHSSPVWQEHWICNVGDAEVSFYSKGYETRLYQKELFLVDGELPAAAV
jgi:hypothetical protein